MNVLEKILEEIDESFDENTQDIEDSEGIHHFVINSSLALCIVKNIIRDYMNKIPDTKNVAKGIDIDSAIDLLKNMQNPKIDYADMVCAPSFCYGKRYVYPDPEDYAIEAAIVALNEKKERESNCDSERHNDWIPVEERLPEPYKLVEVTVHCSEWISDYDSVWVSEDEKIHHSEEYLVSMGYVVNDLGDWAFFDRDGYEIPCDKEFGTDKGDFYSVVTAWRPFEELKPYKGGESWIHRKQ